MCTSTSRHLVDPQHVVGVEVGLADPAALERDLAFEDAPRPKPMPPSICAWMTSGLIAMPQSTAQTTLCTLYPRRPRPRPRPPAPRGAEGLGHRDAARAALGPGPCPSPASRDLLEHRPVARLVLQQREPELERVLARGLRQLVDEHLGREGRVGGADRAPPQHRHADVGGRDELDPEVRHGVGQVDGALDRGRVDAVLHESPRTACPPGSTGRRSGAARPISLPPASSAGLQLCTYIGR